MNPGDTAEEWYCRSEPFSTKEALSLVAREEGNAFFVPNGYQPLLIPQNIEITNVSPQQTMCVQIPIPIKKSLLPGLIVREKYGKAQASNKEIKALTPPRPPNAFILYRKDQHAIVQQHHPGILNSDVSRLIAKMWRSETQLTKDKYHDMAFQYKDAHLQKYPGYRYKPRRCQQTLIKRKMENGTLDPLLCHYSQQADMFADLPEAQPTLDICGLENDICYE